VHSSPRCSSATASEQHRLPQGECAPSRRSGRAYSDSAPSRDAHLDGRQHIPNAPHVTASDISPFLLGMINLPLPLDRETASALALTAAGALGAVVL
jgi:hypothetical protein